MSFDPRAQLAREEYGGREAKAELLARDYEHEHPEAEYGLPKRPGLVRRLLQKLSGKPSGQ